MLNAFLSELTAGQIAGGSTLLVLFFAGIVEISPIKINPWKKAFRALGRAINGEVLEEVAEIKKEVAKIKKQSDERAAKADERDAKAARSRILRFGDECLHDVKHSKEHFDQIMRDIKEYENYCADHPKFENKTAVHTISLISEIYREQLRDHSFL